jgi:endo-1,3(4)-beta-glucanase
LPVKWVRVVGLVVAIDDYAGRRVYTIDDSSNACIEVLETLSVPEKPAEFASEAANETKSKANVGPMTATKVSAYPDIDVGDVVEVKGLLTEFRDEKQINIEKMRPIKSTMEEVILWEKRTKFRKDILEEPWELSQRELRKAQKEAERDEARQVRKREQAESGRDRDRGRNARHTHAEKPIVQKPMNLREILKDSKGKYGALGL